MLYMWNSSMAIGQLGQLFSPDLGEFRSESFVLEHEYMFVQVCTANRYMIILFQ